MTITPFLVVVSTFIAIAGFCAIFNDDRSDKEKRFDDEEQLKYLREHSNNC